MVKKKEKTGKVDKISGPLVIATNLPEVKMYETVRVGKEKLFGEVIEIRSGKCSIQVYENTEGIGPGDPVVPTGMALSVELGPGLITAIFDGVQRPLPKIVEQFGNFITRGADVPALDREKKWHFVPKVKKGDKVSAGDIIGVVQETKPVEHRIMVPYPLSGEVVEIKEKEATVLDCVCKIKNKKGEIIEIQMMQRWPVRNPRPIRKRLNPDTPLVTGQRVVDMFFPAAKGGTACVPGPFGSGKTVIQHQLAKWSDADIIVYVGCGERGNEMTDVLNEFPHLKDPRTGSALIERTVLIANTSNMPVAAREASVFTGITIAEYFRDMGYSVAMMADSTSRWAEAMREISGRLEEMPGEEGYPAYLASRIASFYERAGSVYTLCNEKEQRQGKLSLIGAVSPPGGDLSEPVVQATLRVVKVFWGLDAQLAAQRHFPAINWLTSYSLYQDMVDEYANKNIDPAWKKIRVRAMALLQREAELEELVRLVGIDALPETDRMILNAAKMVREDFLHQNAFDEIDTYTSLQKQFKMLRNIIRVYEKAVEAFEKGAEIDEIWELPVMEKIARSKLIKEEELSKLDDIYKEIEESIEKLIP